MASQKRRPTGSFCGAINCINSRAKCPGKSFFRFPKDKDRCAKWLYNIRRADLDNKSPEELYENISICADHFEEWMFTCPSEKRRLMLCAVPTLFDLPDSQPEIKSGRVRKILATRKPLEGNSSQSDNFSDVTIGHKETMEVDTLNKDDNNIATLSPAPVDTLDKVNGDEELDFTITMNESEDEGSNDAVSSETVEKANVKCASPAQVNGKLSSDDDSQASAPDSAKVAEKEKLEENDSEKEEGGGEKKKNLEKQHNGEKEEDADTEKKEAEHANSGDECKEEEDRANSDVQADSKVSDVNTEKEKTTNEESGDDKSNGEGKEIKSDSEEKQGDGGEKKTKSKDKKADDEDKKADSKGKVTPVKKAESTSGKKPAEEDEDDDVVEIEDSPMKIDGGGDQQTSFKFLNTGSASRGSASNLVLDARTGASVPFMTTAQGASLLPSSSGVQLMLPQGTPGAQGSAVMYVPNSGTFITTSSAAPFLSAINTAQQSQARSNAPLLFSQYTNMPNQANRFAMSSQQNQAARAGQPALAAALTNIPETPTSSKGMIDMIRWEVENHINIKPKYVRPNPKAELGNMAKWSFDLGSDLVKEYVYHDLVRIQHRRKDEGSLSDKEKEDFSKLQQIDKELNQKVGHLKYRLNKSCKCGFKTELDGVLYHHQQHAHIDRGGFLSCPLCKYSSRQPNTFRVHMEGEHGRVGKVENRPSFYECPLCPYETNFTNRLDQHKVRCQRQFRDAFNLHPSCMTGPEVNLCLENVFYYVFSRQFMNSIIPKAATPAISITSATKIRDMPAKAGTTVNSMLASKAGGTAATQLASARHIAPIMAASKTNKQLLPNTLSRNFPVISSKINTITGQGVPSFVANQAAAIAKQAMASTRTPAPKQAPAPNQPNSNFEVCEICGGYVKDRKALRIHFFYAHRIDMPFGVFERPQPPLYCATCFARFWTAQGLQKHIEVHKNDMQSTTQTNNGVAGKCISCGHRVPNILMHMRMVHNRELRHYLAALMCIFCGNRFLTKKETENHMSKMHGVIVKNSSVQSSAPPPKSAAQTPTRPGQQPHKASSTKQSPGPSSSAKEAAAKPASGGKMNRSSQCVLCNLSFSRNVDLTRHCMRVHHTCMKCGLVVVDKESLSRHTCLHSASGMRTCEVCKESGFHPAYYIKHMRDKHLRKCTVVLRRIDRAVVETMKRPITISDSEDEEPSSGPSKSKQQKIYRGVKQVEEGKTKQTAVGGQSDSKKQEEEKAETSSTEVGKEKSDDKEKGEDAEKGDDDKKEDANASKGEMSEDAEQGGEGKKEDPTEVEEEGEKDKNDSDVSEEKAAKEKGKETNSDSDGKGKSNDSAPEESDSAEHVTKDQVPDNEEKEEGEKTAVSESENGVSHEDTDTKSGSLEENAGRRCTRSRKSDSEMDSSEKQNSDNDKTVEDEKKPSSDKSQDPASPKKRKMDTSDGEDSSVRKSLRRSGSKGGDSMDLD